MAKPFDQIPYEMKIILEAVIAGLQIFLFMTFKICFFSLIKPEWWFQLLIHYKNMIDLKKAYEQYSPNEFIQESL